MGIRGTRRVADRLRAGTLACVLASVVLAPESSKASSLVPDGVDLTGGYGNNVAIYAVGVHWNSICACAALKSAGIDLRLAAQLAYWQGKEHPASNSSLWD